MVVVPPFVAVKKSWPTCFGAKLYWLLRLYGIDVAGRRAAETRERHGPLVPRGHGARQAVGSGWLTVP